MEKEMSPADVNVMEVDMESLRQLQLGGGLALGDTPKTRTQIFLDIGKKTCIGLGLIVMIYVINLLAIETAGAAGMGGLGNAAATHGTTSTHETGHVEQAAQTSTHVEVASASGHSDTQEIAEITHPDIQFILCGNLTKDTTLFNIYDYLITCQVVVMEGVTLTVEAGTTVRANQTWDGTIPSIFIVQGAKIIANGTHENPITFTSAMEFIPEGAHGLWGGLVLNGYAHVQHPDTYYGFPFGGGDDEDSSGILSYVRIWYGGYLVNALQLNGVGRGTVMNYVESAHSQLDGVNMHGGTVDLRHLAAYFAADAAIKVDNGYQGRMQHVFVMVATVGNAGLEITGDGASQPRTHPVIRSATFLGNWPHNMGSMMKMHYGAGGSLQNIIIQNAETAVQHDHCYDEAHSQGKQSLPFDFPDYFFFSTNNFIYVASETSTAFAATPDCSGGLTTAHFENPQLIGVPEQLEPLPNGALSPVPLPTSLVQQAEEEEVPGQGFFETVLYAGAFDGLAEDMWVRDWTWLDNNLKLLPKPVENTEYLCGAQKYNKTIFANTSYVLTCQWFVRNGAFLTMMPGSSIMAAEDQTGRSPAIVVERGSKIIADCTKEQPCTFGSNIDPSELPAEGKWGGLVICGAAPTHGNSSMEIAGLKGAEYGGLDPDDFSGVLRYVRVWYGGHQLAPGQYVSGLTLAGVGRQTIVENVEVAYSEDNGIEFFGGTVDAKYLSVLYAKGHGIDFTQGYNGRVQFAFVLQNSDGGYAMNVKSSTLDTDFFKQPRTHPQVRSVTIIGQTDNNHHALLDVSYAAGGSFKAFLMQGRKIFEHTDCANEEVTQGMPTISRPHFLYVSPYNIYMNNTKDVTVVSEDDTCEVDIMNRSRRMAENASGEHHESGWELSYYGDLLGTYRTDRTYDNRREREIAEANYEPGIFKDMPDYSGKPLNASQGKLDPRLTTEAKQVMVSWMRTLQGSIDGDPDDGSFFVPVPYIGAFDAGYGSENNWLEGWTWLAQHDKLAENIFDAAFRPSHFAVLVLVVLYTFSDF